jgi:NAD(P)-dependent dehydrogenase (short-subunit alcohol dehydrogenase family)/aryl carrier-like protein
VDLDPARGTAADEAIQLVSAILDPAREDQLAVRGARWFVPRVQPTDGLPEQLAKLSPDATYLVSGGLGAVGLHVAGWLADRGARHLLLANRSGLRGHETYAAGAVRALEARGVQVNVLALDVADADAVRASCGAAARQGHPVRGVVHAAGVLEPLSFPTLTEDALRAVFHAKIGGAESLHQVTRDLPLDFFVLFSTSSSVTGAEGLSHYTAANQYLDALAHRRRGEGLPALAIDWGRWAVVSRMMSEDRHRWLDAVGMQAFSPEEGLAAFESLVASGTPQAMVLKADQALLQRLASAGRGGFLSALVRPSTTPAVLSPAAPAPARPASAAAHDDSAGVPEGDLRGYVRARVAEALAMEVSALDVDEPINALGLDSIMALQLKNRVETDCGVKVSVVHFLNGDTVSQVAALLAGERAKAASTTTAAGPATPAIAVADLDAAASADLSGLSDEEVEQLLARFLPNESV